MRTIIVIHLLNNNNNQQRFHKLCLILSPTLLKGRNIIPILLMSKGVTEVQGCAQGRTAVSGKAASEIPVSGISHCLPCFPPYIHFRVHIYVIFIFPFIFREISEIVWKQFIKKKAVPDIHMSLSH